MALPSQAECDVLRRFEPRDAHEHALLAQLPEFYSSTPSRERLRATAQRVVRSNEGDRRAMGQAAIVGLCAPRVSPDHALSGAMLLVVLAFVLWLVS